jgi:hypothetical protein
MWAGPDVAFLKHPSRAKGILAGMSKKRILPDLPQLGKELIAPAFCVTADNR